MENSLLRKQERGSLLFLFEFRKIIIYFVKILVINENNKVAHYYFV